MGHPPIIFASTCKRLRLLDAGLDDDLTGALSAA